VVSNWPRAAEEKNQVSLRGDVVLSSVYSNVWEPKTEIPVKMSNTAVYQSFTLGERFIGNCSMNGTNQ